MDGQDQVPAEEDALQPCAPMDGPDAADVALRLGKVALLAASVVAASMGGMPVLPVTIEQDRRRQQAAIHLEDEEASLEHFTSAREAAHEMEVSQRAIGAIAQVMVPTAGIGREERAVQALNQAFEEDAEGAVARQMRVALLRLAQSTTDYHILSEYEEQGES